MGLFGGVIWLIIAGSFIIRWLQFDIVRILTTLTEKRIDFLAIISISFLGRTLIGQQHRRRQPATCSLSVAAGQGRDVMVYRTRTAPRALPAVFKLSTRQNLQAEASDLKSAAWDPEVCRAETLWLAE